MRPPRLLTRSKSGRSGRSTRPAAQAGWSRRWRRIIACKAARKPSLCGFLSSDFSSSSRAPTALPDRAMRFSCFVFTATWPTCTLRRIELTCHPRFSRLSRNLGRVCFSFAASAALGTDSTSWSDSNSSTSHALNSSGRMAAQSFCSAAMRATVGKRLAILSCAFRKSTAPNDVREFDARAGREFCW